LYLTAANVVLMRGEHSKLCHRPYVT